MIASDAPEKPKSTPRRLRLRTLIKLALLIIVILTLIPTLQILVPAISYRDDLIALLNTSDDCQAPCFIGITPGETTREEAIAVLSANAWKYSLEYYPAGSPIGSIPVRYYSIGVEIYFENNIARFVSIYLHRESIPYTTLLMTLGLPDAYISKHSKFYKDFQAFEEFGDFGFYKDSGLQVISDCLRNWSLASGIFGLRFYAKNDEINNDLLPYRFHLPGCNSG